MIKSKKGYSLMELVVSVSILATLAAVSIPSFIEVGQQAKGAKSQDNLSNIQMALLSQYAENASLGDALHSSSNSSAIATFNEELISGESVDMDPNQVIIKYGLTGELTWEDIFPSGIPTSPFGDEPYEIVSVTEGYAFWETTGIVSLQIIEVPTITIRDKNQPSIILTITP